MSDINTLMDRDPLSLTNDDITALINIVRQGRAQFNLGAKDPTAKTVKAKANFAAPGLKLDLTTLGLKKKD